MTRPHLVELEPREVLAALVAVGMPDGTVAVGSNRFTPFEGFRGPLSVAVDADAQRVYVGAGVGGGPRVAAFDLSGRRVAGDWFAFEDTFRGGVEVAAADGRLYVGAGPGGGPVLVTYGEDLAELRREVLGDPAERGGLRLSASAEATGPTVYAPPPAFTVGDPGGYRVWVRWQTPTTEAAAVEVLGRAAELLAGVGLSFTTTRPAAGAYGTVEVVPAIAGTGTGQTVGDSSFVGAWRSPLTFTVPVLVADRFGPDFTAETMAHEIGHALGLQHRAAAGALMNPVGSPANVALDPEEFATIHDAAAAARARSLVGYQ